MTDLTQEQAVDAALEELSMEELRAELVKTRAELTQAKVKPARKAAAPTLSPEEQEELNAKIAAAKEELAVAEAAYNKAKAALKELQPRSGGGGGNRGPAGVGAYIKDLIKEGLTNDEILAKVAVDWPDNMTNANCVNWYRSALKKWTDGKRPPLSKTAEPLKGDAELDDAEFDDLDAEAEAAV